MSKITDYSIVIPTLNAGGGIIRLVDCLNSQTIKPNLIYIVDSSSNDDTVSLVKDYENVVIEVIKQKEFNHGKTRDDVFRKIDNEFVVFMTQDALPVDNSCMESLLDGFNNENIAACSARQIAYDKSTSYEKLVRFYNYPSVSRTWNKDDIRKLGINAFLISNVCCAYRRSAYLKVGGFDKVFNTNEDMLMAQKLLEYGYSLKYCANACVYHSHDFSFIQEYKRNYIIGKTLEGCKERFNSISYVSKGGNLFRKISKDLLKEHKYIDTIKFTFDCIARFAGNRIGRVSWKLWHK